MNILRWILGIPLAFLICLGILMLFITYTDDAMHKHYNPQLFLFFHSSEIVFDFSLLIFLSCMFTPVPKKYSAFISILIVFILAGIGIYIQLTDKFMGGISLTLIVSYASLFAGLSLGIVLSYLKYKNNGWDRPIVEIDTQDTY